MTVRLIKLAKREWANFDGSSSSDPMDLRPDRFLNRVYAWAIRNAQDQEEINKFDRHLWMPPKGVAAAPGSPWSPEAERAAFQNLAAAFGTSKSTA